MKAHWQKLAARFDALVLRERWLVVGTVLGGIVWVGAMQFIDPALKRARLAERGLADQHMLLASLQSQAVALQSAGKDPDVAARAELADLRKKLADLGGRLVAMERSLVPPQRMAALLEDIVGRSKGLQLISLRTLPVSPVLEKPAANVPNAPAGGAAAAPLPVVPDASAGLFKHGIEIQLEGSYADLAAYLARLEKAEVKLLWSDVSMSSEQYPKLQLKLTVFTLSLDRTWLTV